MTSTTTSRHSHGLSYLCHCCNDLSACIDSGRVQGEDGLAYFLGRRLTSLHSATRFLDMQREHGVPVWAASQRTLRS